MKKILNNSSIQYLFQCLPTWFTGPSDLTCFEIEFRVREGSFIRRFGIRDKVFISGHWKTFMIGFTCRVWSGRNNRGTPRERRERIRFRSRRKKVGNRIRFDRARCWLRRGRGWRTGLRVVQPSLAQAPEAPRQLVLRTVHAAVASIAIAKLRRAEHGGGEE